MGNWALLLGIIPLLLFVIVDSFAGLKAGLITAMVVALLEAALSLYLFGTIDSLTLTAVALVLVMSLFSWRNNSDVMFKMQPVIFGGVLSLALIVSYLMGQPLLYVMLTKYQYKMPAEIQAQMNNPLYQELLKQATIYCGFTIMFQTSLVAYAALRMNNWWWIAIRGIGFYIFLFLGFLIAQFSL